MPATTIPVIAKSTCTPGADYGRVVTIPALGLRSIRFYFDFINAVDWGSVDPSLTPAEIRQLPMATLTIERTDDGGVSWAPDYIAQFLVGSVVKHRDGLSTLEHFIEVPCWRDDWKGWDAKTGQPIIERRWMDASSYRAAFRVPKDIEVSMKAECQPRI